jgi:hypothetical protein
VVDLLARRDDLGRQHDGVAGAGDGRRRLEEDVEPHHPRLDVAERPPLHLVHLLDVRRVVARAGHDLRWVQHRREQPYRRQRHRRAVPGGLLQRGPYLGEVAAQPPPPAGGQRVTVVRPGQGVGDVDDRLVLVTDGGEPLVVEQGQLQGFFS